MADVSPSHVLCINNCRMFCFTLLCVLFVVLCETSLNSFRYKTCRQLVMKEWIFSWQNDSVFVQSYTVTRGKVNSTRKKATKKRVFLRTIELFFVHKLISARCSRFHQLKLEYSLITFLTINFFFYLFKQKIKQDNLKEKKDWFTSLCILKCVMQIYVCMVHGVVMCKLTSWKSKYKINWKWFWKTRV